MTEHPGVDAEQYIGSRIDHLNITVISARRVLRRQPPRRPLFYDQALAAGATSKPAPCLRAMSFGPS